MFCATSVPAPATKAANKKKDERQKQLIGIIIASLAGARPGLYWAPATHFTRKGNPRDDLRMKDYFIAANAPRNKTSKEPSLATNASAFSAAAR